MAKDLREEMEAHLQMSLDERKDDRDAARKQFGNLTLLQENAYDSWGFPVFEALLQDLRYTSRMLRRSPSFTLVAVLSLAFGIGATAVLFSALDRLMYRSLPVRNPESLVKPRVAQPNDLGYFTFDQFQRFRAMHEIFADVTSFIVLDRYDLKIDGKDAGPASIGIVSGNHFSMLGVKASIGRTLTDDDDRVPGGHPVAVISDRYWERCFGRARDIVGRSIVLNATRFAVIGVADRNFTGLWIGRPTDIWTPVMMQQQVNPDRPWTRYSAMLVARLRRGIGREQAQAAADTVYQQAAAEQAGPNAAAQDILRISRGHLALERAGAGFSPQRDTFGTPLLIGAGIAFLVLLIACANVASLLLARAAGRQREMALRAAIGVGMPRLVRQLLTENMVLSLAGGAMGLLFAWWGSHFLSGALRTGYVGFNASATTIELDLHLDGMVFGSAAILAVLTGLLFGIAPALFGAKVSLAGHLTGRGSGMQPGRSVFRLSRVLLVSQVAVTLVLVIGAGLFVRTVHNLMNQDLGVDRQHVLLVWTEPGQTGRSAKATLPLFEAAQPRIAAVPGVISASSSVYGLLNANTYVGPSVQVTGCSPREDAYAQLDIVMPRYFETLGMRLLEGRDFSLHDNETAPRVAVVNETLARYFCGAESAIGKRLIASGRAEMQIVGVVSDAKHILPRERKMMFYAPYRQDIGHLLQMVMVLRVARMPLSVASDVRRALHDLDPSLPVVRIGAVDEQHGDLFVTDRLIERLSIFFGGLALMLACLGLYGVMAHTVAQRTNEIGIRVAVGATSAGVQRMVLKQGLTLALLGVLFGLPAAWAVARLIAPQLFGLTPFDPLAIAGGVLLVVAVTGLAGLPPARRAARVDPIVALRHE